MRVLYSTVGGEESPQPKGCDCVLRCRALHLLKTAMFAGPTPQTTSVPGPIDAAERSEFRASWTRRPGHHVTSTNLWQPAPAHLPGPGGK